MTTFVDYLLKQQDDTFIIKPSKYFEPGLDADDLMYMWEIVKEGGLINIWRFQTYQDIEKSFELMDERFRPSGWARTRPIQPAAPRKGPSRPRFLRKTRKCSLSGRTRKNSPRRTDYGIGLFHDTRLTQNIFLLTRMPAGGPAQRWLKITIIANYLQSITASRSFPKL